MKQKDAGKKSARLCCLRLPRLAAAFHWRALLCCLSVLVRFAFQGAGLKDACWLLVTSQLFARVEKMLRPKRAWTLDPQVTVSSPVGLNNITWHENDSTIECWKPWSNGNTIPLAWTRKFATVSLWLCWEEKGQVELRWGESTRVQRRWEEKREMKRELRRCAQKWRSLKRDDERWEVVGRVDKWFHNLRQEVRSPGKEHRSLPQLL